MYHKTQVLVLLFLLQKAVIITLLRKLSSYKQNYDFLTLTYLWLSILTFIFSNFYGSPTVEKPTIGHYAILFAFHSQTPFIYLKLKFSYVFGGRGGKMIVILPHTLYEILKGFKAVPSPFVISVSAFRLITGRTPKESVT